MIPLHTAVAAIRRHQPTKDVVPHQLRYVDITVALAEPRGFWKWDCDEYNTRDIPDDAARLIVEACMWRHHHGTYNAKDIASNGHLYLHRGCWNSAAPANPGSHKYRAFDDDILAALMFACGVPVPTKETP